MQEMNKTDLRSQDERWLLAEKYGQVVSPEYLHDCERLAQGEPLAYVIGHVPFLGTRIDLSLRPLIPRVETEYWVAETIREIHAIKADTPIRVLDIFAGSGCIGVALLLRLVHSNVDFVDIDKDAATQVSINCKLNGIDTTRYAIYTSDICNTLPLAKYDYIFANPPYIPDARELELDSSVVAHEPHRALFGGDDGLRVIERFLQDIVSYMHATTVLYMEYDETQRAVLEEVCTKFGYISEFRKDQYGVDRYVLLRQDNTQQRN